MILCKIPIRVSAHDKSRGLESDPAVDMGWTSNVVFLKSEQEPMGAIFTLSIACVGGRHLKEPYEFAIEAPVALTLGDLASYILRMVDFEEDNHLDEFYLANGRGGKKTTLTPNGEWDADDAQVMALRLCDVFPLPKHKKLYYLYDFGASWRFQITKQGRQTEALPAMAYPRIVSETGVKPNEFGEDSDEDDDSDGESDGD